MSNETRIARRLRRVEIVLTIQSAVVAAVLAMLVASLACGGELPGAVKRIAKPADAVRIAYADAVAISNATPQALPQLRYLFMREPSDANRAALGYILNTALNHAGDSYGAVSLADGLVWRVDLALYADAKADKLVALLAAWERQRDAQFYLLTDALKQVFAPRFVLNGKAFSQVSVKRSIPAPYADPQGELTALAAMLVTEIPILSAEQFARFALGTARADGDAVNPIANDGLYYEFRAIEPNPEKQTAEAAFLARAGVDLAEFGERNVDQRVALVRTPTGSPGIVEYAPSTATRPSIGPSIATITRDYFQGAIRADKHPFENLLDRKHDGSEAITFKQDGGLEFALFDARGGLVREAPPNLASDNTNPHVLKRLHGAISCIRCHGPNAMFQPAPNYITALRGVAVDGARFDVFAGDEQTTRRLVSLFNGETVDAFATARLTHAKFSILSSGQPTEAVAAAVASLHDGWLYGDVDPAKVVKLLGYDCGEDNWLAVDVFNRICPPIGIEPLRVTQIRAWRNEFPLRMTVDDLLSVYPEIATRVLAWESM